jgi:hypothetical protein
MRLFGFLALVLGVGLVVGVHSAHATGVGSISIDPATSDVTEGGGVNVSVIFDPPDTTVGVFIIEIQFDPNVLKYAGCLQWTPPPIGVGAAGCDAKDTDLDGVKDTAVVFGGYIINQGGVPVGFSTTQNVGTIAFQAIGSPGQSSALTMSAPNNSLLGPNAEVLTPALGGGTVHIHESLSVGGVVDMVTTRPGGSGWNSPAGAALPLAAALIAGSAIWLRRRFAR